MFDDVYESSRMILYCKINKLYENKPFGKCFNTVSVAGSPAIIFAVTISGTVNKWDNTSVGLETTLRIDERKLSIHSMYNNFYTCPIQLLHIQ